jgi:hypothetical protein
VPIRCVILRGTGIPYVKKIKSQHIVGLRSASITRAVRCTYTQTAPSRLGEVHNAFQIVSSRPTCYVIQIAVPNFRSRQQQVPETHRKHHCTSTTGHLVSSWYQTAFDTVSSAPSLRLFQIHFGFIITLSYRQQFVTGSAAFTFHTGVLIGP